MKKHTKKLALKSETMVNLSVTNLHDVQGGAAQSYKCTGASCSVCSPTAGVNGQITCSCNTCNHP